jgi:putative nucleotidyltransferase with HDIG domain
MKQDVLEKLRTRFDDYVTGFYGEDEYVNANLKMKQLHSRRTCAVMIKLADQIGLDANQKRIAETIALFHDIGRFEQFVRHRTYNDAKSVNHCELGLQVLRETNLLASVDTAEREVIEKAIKYHGRKELPSDLSGQCLLFSRLIRDADKVDVLHVITKYHQQYRDNKADSMLEALLLELPDEPWCSAGVVEALLHGRRIDHKELRTMNDMRLLLIGWVYDVNFTATLKLMREHRLFDIIFEFLPETGDVERVRRKVFRYIDSKITTGDMQ